MMEQPQSVIEGSAMAATGSMLLGFRRAHYAMLILPLMYGDTAEQRRAAEGYETLSAGLRRHPEVVDTATKGVTWTAASAELAMGAVADYASDAGEKAALPAASARTLNVTADVYDAAGKAVFLTGASILTAGVMHKVAQLNPFTRVASEVAATQFGIRADRQAGVIASRVRQFVTGGQGVLGKVAGRLAQVSPGKLALGGGAAAAGGGMLGQQAVADRLSATKLQQTPPGQAPPGLAPQGLTPQGLTPQGLTPQGPASQGLAPQGLAPQGPAPFDAQLPTTHDPSTETET